MARTRKKKISRDAKRRLLIFGTISAALIIYFFVSLATYAINIAKLKEQQRDLNAQMVSLRDSEENLKLEIQKLKDPDYIARFARENYLYSKNGEYIIKIEDKSKKEKTKKVITSIPVEYIAMAGGVLFLITVFMIAKKSKLK